MTLPGCRVEVSGHSALEAQPVRSPFMGEWAAQIVLPASEEPLQNSFGRLVQSMTTLGLIFNHLLIYYADTLHFQNLTFLNY